MDGQSEQDYDRELRTVLSDHRNVLADLAGKRWRTGRTNGRNVYARTGGDNWKDDVPVGAFDTPELAAEAVSSHNARLGFFPGP